MVDALRANQARAKVLEQALATARRPPIDAAFANHLEESALADLKALRELLKSWNARSAIAKLFPNGLRFKVKDGL